MPLAKKNNQAEFQSCDVNDAEEISVLESFAFGLDQ